MPSQFGDGRVSGGRPTMIGVGERLGVTAGVNAGRGDVAEGRGAGTAGVELVVAGVEAGVGVVTGAVFAGCATAGTI